MKQNFRKYLWTLAAIIAFIPAVYAEDEFDFVIVATKCKTLVSYNIMSEDSLRVIEADTPVLFCNRDSRVIACDISHVEEPDKRVKRTYKLELDSPPILFFQAENGSESAFIDTSNNTASYSTRTFGETFMGYKVCNAMFFTYDQYEMLSDD